MGDFSYWAILVWSRPWALAFDINLTVLVKDGAAGNVSSGGVSGSGCGGRSSGAGLERDS